MVLQSVLNIGYVLLDKGLVPDLIIRLVIRALLHQRLREIDRGSFEANHTFKMQWIEQVRARERIAEVPEKANEQLYQVKLVRGRTTSRLTRSLGSYQVYSVNAGPVCKIFTVSLPDWPRNSR